MRVLVTAAMHTCSRPRHFCDLRSGAWWCVVVRGGAWWCVQHDRWFNERASPPPSPRVDATEEECLRAMEIQTAISKASVASLASLASIASLACSNATTDERLSKLSPLRRDIASSMVPDVTSRITSTELT